MLQPGARIAIVAPGSALAPQDVSAAMDWIAACGWEPVQGTHLYRRHRYLAGDTSQRLADLQWALTAPTIDALWFARGGYGTAQLLPLLDWRGVTERPVIGFSDATALLWALYRRGVPSVHAPVLSTLVDGAHAVDEESRAALKTLLLTGASPRLSAIHLCGPTGAVQGPMVGGNLSVLASLAGTAEALRAEGAVVVLEDVKEQPYRLERSLRHLLDSGGLAGAQAIVMGEFVDCQPPASAGFQLSDIWRELLEPLSIPVYEGLPIGHGRRNVAFRYGAWIELKESGIRAVERQGRGTTLNQLTPGDDVA
jgi:muramoyltetrapeptide carboxypeptidase